MAKSQDPSRKKGTFGPVRLPVAKKYMFPSSRRAMMLAGGTGSALLLLYFLFSAFLLNDTFSAPGALSSNHANFESECVKCHRTISGVLSSKCSTCHEKTNDRLGIYTYAAHYLYRSAMPARIDSARIRHMGDEGTCATCHPEHRGSGAQITRAPDSKCVTCHDDGSFDDDHPEFEFARRNVPDDSTLIFTHIRHTKFVLERVEKQTGSTLLEKACLYCHNPQPDGRGFKPLDFDMHCGDCHLTASTETPPLAVKNPGDPMTPGVETLQMIQQRRGPGTLWSFYTNPNEFMTRGGTRIVKSPVYHRDPWIMENLRQIRRTLFVDSGLAELLAARREGTSKSGYTAYSEALATLRTYAAGLRSRPETEVQRNLVTIDSLLRIAERRLSNQGAALPLASFSTEAPNPQLSPEQRTAFEDLAQKLVRPCLVCHVVEQAGILSVAASQGTLRRAEFDHRAHVVERRCLECHTEIPVERALLNAHTTGVAQIDRASTHNIPRIANCLECHTSGKAANACITCHFMHPNKENRGNLQLAFDRN
jgi:hypothetical protein